MLGDGSEAGEGGGGVRWGSPGTYGTPGSGGVAEYLHHKVSLKDGKNDKNFLQFFLENFM